MSRDDRAKFDASLQATTTSTRLPVMPTTAEERRALPAPSWWKGEEHAAMLGVEMIRRLDRIRQ